MEIVGGGGGVKRKISADEVISKLKDDGDFDNLRLKIIRKLKENEELRNNIASMVKQSVALNRPGAENMKPRQLADAIHQEVGGQILEQISDGLWEIIKAGDGMKVEIAETVKLVYNRLLKPEENVNCEPSHSERMPVIEKPDDIVDIVSDGEVNEPPGFSHNNINGNGICKVKIKEELIEELGNGINSQAVLGPTDALDPSSPPGFSAGMQDKQPCDGSDSEDLDVPPGFG